MRKFRRLTAAVLSLLMILSMAGTAFAAATPYLGGKPCHVCNIGNVSVNVERILKDAYVSPHQFHEDFVRVYQVITHEKMRQLQLRKQRLNTGNRYILPIWSISILQEC